MNCKLIGSIVCTLAFSLGLAACGSSAGVVAGSSTGAAPAGSPGPAAAHGAATPYTGIPTKDSQVFTDLMRAADGVNGSSGQSAKVQYLVDNFDPQAQLKLFSSVFSQGCAGCAMSILPVTASNVKPLVTAAVAAKASITTMYEDIPNYYPWTVGPSWVAYMGYDGVQSGYENAKALFASMGGKGGVIEILGTPGPGVAADRLTGFEKALGEFPGIKVLDQQIGNWSQATAQQITSTELVKFGSEIKGVLSENDGMALGVVQALRAKGLNGKVGVTGSDGGNDSLALVKSGDMVSTMLASGALAGAVSTALAHAAAVGDIDVSKLSHAQRYFNLQQHLVTKANVDQYLDKPINADWMSYAFWKKNFWSASAGAIAAP